MNEVIKLSESEKMLSIKKETNGFLIIHRSRGLAIRVSALELFVGMGSCRCGDLECTLINENGNIKAYGDTGYGIDSTVSSIQKEIEEKGYLSVQWYIDPWERYVTASLRDYAWQSVHIEVPNELKKEFKLAK